MGGLRRCTRERAKVSCTGGGEECASGSGDANKQRIGGVKSSTWATESSGGVVAWWPCWCCAGHSWMKHKCPPAADSWLVTGHRPVIVMPGLVASPPDARTLRTQKAHITHRLGGLLLMRLWCMCSCYSCYCILYKWAILLFVALQQIASREPLRIRPAYPLHHLLLPLQSGPHIHQLVDFHQELVKDSPWQDCARSLAQ